MCKMDVAGVLQLPVQMNSNSSEGTGYVHDGGLGTRPCKNNLDALPRDGTPVTHFITWPRWGPSTMTWS